MANLIVTQRTRNIKGGMYPIIVRVRHLEQQSERTVPNIRIESKYWDDAEGKIKVSRRKDPMYNRAPILNSQINAFKRKVEKAMDELHIAGAPFGPSDVFERAFGKKKKLNSISFSNYLNEYIDVNPDELAFGTLKYYTTTLNTWKKCHAGLKVKDLKERDIVKYRQSLRKSGISTNTIYTRMKTVRKMVRRARKQGLLDNDPFEHLSLKQEEGNREHLTMEEVKALEQVKPIDKSESIVKDIFLFGCYTGLRFSDMCRLKNKHIKKTGKNYRLNFKMSKTRENLSFKIADKAKRILLKYESDKGSNYVFPYLSMLVEPSEKAITRRISSANAVANCHIKDLAERAKIKKHCSMHVSRHTYACISLEIGADIYVLSKMLGHGSLKSTQIYAKVVDKRKDELVDMWNKQ